MVKKLAVLVNGEIVFEFDRDTSFEEQQLAYLDKMDSDMAGGIRIQGELLENPDSHQRATFIAMNLLKALQQENEASTYASCAYLVQRLPALIEVHANDHGDTVKIELVEE